MGVIDIARAYELFHARYNDAVTFLRTPPKGIRIVVAAPSVQTPAGRFERNRDRIRQTIAMGRSVMANLIVTKQFP